MAACDPFSGEEMLRMMNTEAFCRGGRLRNRALFALECCTGARVSEVLRLKRGDVIGEDGFLRHRITFTRTKNKHPRTVPVANRFLTPYLSAWLKFQQENGYMLADDPLFPARGTCRPISRVSVWRLYRKAARELGLGQRIGTHSCRKTWAKTTYEYYQARQRAGESVDPLLKLKEAGGWRNLDSASRYLNFMLGDTGDSQAAIYSEISGNKITKHGKVE